MSHQRSSRPSVSCSERTDCRRRRRQVRLGPRTVEFPSPQLQPLIGSAASIASAPPSSPSPSELRERLETHGYLFVPGLLPRSKVFKAREAIVSHLKARGVLREPDATTSTNTSTITSSTCMAEDAPDTVKMEGFGGISLHPDVKALLEGNELFEFFRDVVFGGGGGGNDPCTSTGTCSANTVRTFDYKWIRAVGQNHFTGVHSDSVYMSRGSTQLLTAWIPLGDNEIEHGTLAVIDKSHALESYAPIRQTYGRMDVDLDKIEGWLSKDPSEITDKYGGQWQTTDFEAGDVIIFGMQTLHCSTTNMQPLYRLSCDVRFQPTKDAIDERWVLASENNYTGEKEQGTGHTSHGKMELRSMDDARREWGI